MGSFFANNKERDAYYAQLEIDEKAQREAAKQRKDQRRMELAAKIAMVVIDKVNRDIIRPGPDPEERECYDMSKELRDIAPEMEALIAQVLAVNSNTPSIPR